MFRVIDLSPETGYYPYINSTEKTKWLTHCKCKAQFAFEERGKGPPVHRVASTPFAPTLKLVMLENKVPITIRFVPLSSSGFLKFRNHLDERAGFPRFLRERRGEGLRCKIDIGILR